MIYCLVLFCLFGDLVIRLWVLGEFGGFDV